MTKYAWSDPGSALPQSSHVTLISLSQFSFSLNERESRKTREEEGDLQERKCKKAQHYMLPLLTSVMSKLKGRHTSQDSHALGEPLSDSLLGDHRGSPWPEAWTVAPAESDSCSSEAVCGSECSHSMSCLSPAPAFPRAGHLNHQTPSGTSS